MKGITWSTVKTFDTGLVLVNYASIGRGLWIRIGAEPRITLRDAQVLASRESKHTLASLRAAFGREIATSK